MTAVREAWTDERLDDLATSMRTEFAELRADMRALRGELGEVRAEVGAVREEIGELRGEMRAGFAAINRTLQISAALIGAMFVGLMGMIGTQL
ncbi:MAG: hypothetical protein M3335_01915 [Actinomycetota bacterium]|nr:hypothetical protein [Actinomycetota bacterium]